jgi:DNA-binding transcriptional regulator LsrR (DeoR family)
MGRDVASNLTYAIEPGKLNAEDLEMVSPVDAEQQVLTRAAWLYFVAGHTQSQIGRALGITRVRVNRLLAQAREEGVVQINISGRLANCVVLEDAIKRRFNLQDAVVVPTPRDHRLLPQIIGTAAGQYLGSRLVDGLSIGVGWGRTLRFSLRSVPRKNYRDLSVVSLMGGLTHSSLINPHETASHLADILGARCYYIAAPALTDTEATRDIMMNQPMLREVFDRARKTDLALVSVGDLAEANTMLAVGLIGSRDVASLRDAGAVGDICCHWIDKSGATVDHALNRRVIGLAPSDLVRAKCVVLASGGMNKIVVLRGVLAAGCAGVLVTDEQTAQGLVDLD